MKTLSRTTQFKRDYRREKKSYAALDEKLTAVLELLVSGSDLPQQLRDHPLGGEWQGCRDCHVRPDLLLIYILSDDEIRLVRLGSHSELFG